MRSKHVEPFAFIFCIVFAKATYSGDGASLGSTTLNWFELCSDFYVCRSVSIRKRLSILQNNVFCLLTMNYSIKNL